MRQTTTRPFAPDANRAPSGEKEMRSIGSVSCVRVCRQLWEMVSQSRIVQSFDADASIRRVSGWDVLSGSGCHERETMEDLWPMSLLSGVEEEPLGGFCQT